MSFGNWPEELHSDRDQQKRIASARSAKTTPNSIDKNRQIAVFSGSGAVPYTTTLDSCTCVDFVRRKLPCKHIYRLAIELGLLGLSAKSGVNKNNLIPWDEAVAELENLSDKSQLLIKQFFYQEQAKSEGYLIPAKFVGDDLLACPLIKKIEAPLLILKSFKRQEIIGILDEHGITGFKRNMSIQALSEWCLDNVPNILNLIPHTFVFRFSDSFQKWHKKVFTYLRRKYESISHSYVDTNDNLQTYVVPHGAQFYSAEGTDSWLFPDDDITHLLNQYGHNRNHLIEGNRIFCKSFVLAGEFVRFSRYEARCIIWAYGGRIFDSVHEKTSYVVAGENADSKLQDAKGMGIPVLTEDEFWALISPSND